MKEPIDLSSPNLITVDAENEDDDSSDLCRNKLCWYVPPLNSLPVAFCNETTIHGFKFLGQEKRHLTERSTCSTYILHACRNLIFLVTKIYIP